MGGKRVLIDLDSTVADLMTPWLSIYNQEFSDNLTIDMLDTFDTHLRTKDGKEDIYEILQRPGLFRSLKPYDGAVDAVRRIAKEHEVYIVTASPEGPAASEKIAWVLEHLPFINKKHIVIMHHKHLINADVLIDDGPHNAVAFREAHPSAEIYGLWFPHNQMCNAFTTLFYGHKTPARGWAQIAERLL